jgi:hypothetical protein
MADAYRLRRGDTVLYVMPFEEQGRRVVYRQDVESFDTTRETVDVLRARRLASEGREVGLYETPAWCDPRAPRDSSALTAP